MHLQKNNLQHHKIIYRQHCGIQNKFNLDKFKFIYNTIATVQRLNMATKKDYDKALYRYADMLSRIALDERPTNKFFMDEYNVSERTVQRDLKKLQMNFPLTKDSNGGWMFNYNFNLKNSTYSTEEAISLTNALLQVKKAGNEFEKAVDILFKKFIFPTYKNPYYIKPPLYQYIDMDSPLLNKIEDAILYNNISILHIKRDKINIEPYKIINYDGIWYLMCKDIDSNKLIHLVVAKIDDIEVLSQKFTIREDIDKLLQEIDSPHYIEGQKYEVIIEVSSNISEYFLLKQHLPSQKLIKQHENGSITISYMVTHEEEIDNLIKSWLPDIQVISPKTTKERILTELKNYINNT